MDIFNRNKLPETDVERYSMDAVTLYLGKAAGTRGFYVNIDIVPPGASSTKYHSHTCQEEFFLILRGRGRLRTADGEREVGPGDFLSKLPEIGNPHSFYNHGEEPLEILDVGTMVRGDVCYYPDEDVYLVKETNLAFQGGDALKAWSSDPDESQ